MINDIIIILMVRLGKIPSHGSIQSQLNDNHSPEIQEM